MRVSLLCSVASVFLASAAFAQGEGEFPATLKGHAVLSAETFIDAPADAQNLASARGFSFRDHSRPCSFFFSTSDNSMAASIHNAFHPSF